MGAMASQITSRTIVNSTVYIQAQIQESIKSPLRTGLCAGNSPVTTWGPMYLHGWVKAWSNLEHGWFKKHRIKPLDIITHSCANFNCGLAIASMSIYTTQKIIDIQCYWRDVTFWMIGKPKQYIISRYDVIGLAREDIGAIGVAHFFMFL